MHEDGQLDKNTPSEVLREMPKTMCDWVRTNYKKIDKEHMTEEEKNLNWETACPENTDWKYGRFKLCREKKLYRGLTFNEFYGGGIVD